MCLLYGKLRERVTRAGKMERYCPLGIARFVPAITFRRSPSGCTKVFFLKIFSVFGQDGWILAEFSFGVFMDRDEVDVHKDAKRERGQYAAILTSRLVNNREL